jgi:hypothetical protein
MQSGQARRRYKEIMPRRSSRYWNFFWKRYLHKTKMEHATLRGERSYSEPDLAYMRGWDEDGESDREAQEAAKQRAQQEQLYDLETAEGMRPEKEEDQEELSLAHVTDTVQRNKRSKQKEWTLQTDTPVAESGANSHSCVQVTGADTRKD